MYMRNGSGGTLSVAGIAVRISPIAFAKRKVTGVLARRLVSDSGDGDRKGCPGVTGIRDADSAIVKFCGASRVGKAKAAAGGGHPRFKDRADDFGGNAWSVVADG